MLHLPLHPITRSIASPNDHPLNRAALSTFILPVPMRLFTLVVALTWSLSAGAQDVDIPNGEPARTPGHDGRAAYMAYDDPVIALVGVVVMDGTGEAARRDQTVLIDRGWVTGVGPADSVRIPEGARVLHLPHRTVIPGLVGMHDLTHMPGMASRLWLASGVTTVQTAGSAEPEAEAALALAIESGEEVGPTIFSTPHYITGPDGNGPMTKPSSEGEARELVRRWSDGGATWFKLYRHVEPHIAAAVIDEAHAQGRKVTGHLRSLTFREAALMGHCFVAALGGVFYRTSGRCTFPQGESRIAAGERSRSIARPEYLSFLR